jgi:hypothetical protein
MAECPGVAVVGLAGVRTGHPTSQGDTILGGRRRPGLQALNRMSGDATSDQQ